MSRPSHLPLRLERGGACGLGLLLVWGVYLLASHQGVLALMLFALVLAISWWLLMRKIPLLWLTAFCLLFLPVVIVAPKQAVRYYRLLSSAAVVGIAGLLLETDTYSGKKFPQ